MVVVDQLVVVAVEADRRVVGQAVVAEQILDCYYRHCLRRFPQISAGLFALAQGLYRHHQNQNLWCLFSCSFTILNTQY